MTDNELDPDLISIGELASFRIKINKDKPILCGVWCVCVSVSKTGIGLAQTKKPLTLADIIFINWLFCPDSSDDNVGADGGGGGNGQK